MTCQETPALATERLTRIAGGKTLVADVTVHVKRGEVLVVTGPSGSGKSSFLRLLNRLDEPTGGVVRVDGIDYREMAPRDLRRKVGMVTQRAFLFPGTVADNLRFGPRQRGITLSDEQVADLLFRVGLTGYDTRDVANLSGGESQRVSLARALANSPIVLLLDEPTAALDESAKSGIESLIAQIVRETHLTCLMVTHDTAQAGRMAERIMLIEAGRAVGIGPVTEFIHG
jgi:putative ABC transport system ATP-binding protein